MSGLEAGPSISDFEEMEKEKLLRENPELTESDAEKLAEEKIYYRPKKEQGEP